VLFRSGERGRIIYDNYGAGYGVAVYMI
jgi:hypothetical protein